MIFRQWQDVLDGVKTQTRRVLKSYETVVVRSDTGVEYTVNFPGLIERVDGVWSTFGLTIIEVRTSNGLLKHKVGRNYPIIPKRAEPQVGRFLLEGIRVERLQSISATDAIAEGVDSVEAYRDLWESINGSVAAWRWSSNPVVLVYEIKHRNMNYRAMLEAIGSK